MKDLKGREYDGWVLKTRQGKLLGFTLERTRWDIYRNWHHRKDCWPVKVRLVEVGKSAPFGRGFP